MILASFPGSAGRWHSKYVETKGCKSDIDFMSIRELLANYEVDMNQTLKFWDKIAEKFAKQPIADEASYQKKLEVTRQYLRPDMEVMEFGCGTGSTAIAHAPFVKRILATDISSNMLEIGRRNAEAANVRNVDFQQAGINDVEVPDESLDAVFGFSILHLLEDRDDAVSRVYRMLKPGGVFISSTACLEGIIRAFVLVAPLGRLLGLMPMIKIPTRQALETSLTGAGFEIEYQWQPGKGKALFIVARKPGE